jgi:hypothetical protein
MVVSIIKMPGPLYRSSPDPEVIAEMGRQQNKD